MLKWLFGSRDDDDDYNEDQIFLEETILELSDKIVELHKRNAEIVDMFTAGLDLTAASLLNLKTKIQMLEKEIQEIKQQAILDRHLHRARNSLNQLSDEAQDILENTEYVDES